MEIFCINMFCSVQKRKKPVLFCAVRLFFPNNSSFLFLFLFIFPSELLLYQVEYPADVSYTTGSKFKRWLYTNYNFTLAAFWSPYLVKATDTKPKNWPTKSNNTRLTNLYLNEADSNWTSQIGAFDYVIISAGRWFFGPKMYYENGHVVGCHFCKRNDTKELTMFYGYKRAFKSAFEALLRLESFKGVVILRTLSPAHFENGEWNEGGECKRTEPVSRSEMKMNWGDLELYLSQIEVMRAVEREGKTRGVKFRLLDITKAMEVRPDGHPNHFGHWPQENVTIADCVHWCLPGPIDSWNELLLHMLKQDQCR